MSKSWAKASNEELDTAQQDVMARRAAAEQEFKAEAAAIQAERDRRQLDQQIAALSPEVVAAIKAKTVVVEED